MNRHPLHLLALAPVLLLAACAAANLGDEEQGSTEGALHETLSHARSCASVRAYEAASLEDFRPLDPAFVPAKVAEATDEDVSLLAVTGVGNVYVSSGASGTTSIYDKNGNLLATGDASTGSWSDKNAPLDCGASDAGSEAGSWIPSSPRSGWTNADDGGAEGGDPWVWTPPPAYDADDAGDGG